MGRTGGKTVGGEIRPIAKALVQGGLRLYDASREAVVKTGERLKDLLAEARAEMSKGDSSTSRKSPSESPRRRKGIRPKNR